MVYAPNVKNFIMVIYQKATKDALSEGLQKRSAFVSGRLQPKTFQTKIRTGIIDHAKKLCPEVYIESSI
jgi:hypothetical protein